MVFERYEYMLMSDSVWLINLFFFLLLLLTNKFNVVFSPEELQGHGTHVNRRRVQYSTVLVERRNCAISMICEGSDFWRTFGWFFAVWKGLREFEPAPNVLDFLLGCVGTTMVNPDL